MASLSILGDTATLTYEFSVFQNGVEHQNASCEQNTTNNTSRQSVSINDLNFFNAGDAVDVRVQCTTNAGKAITIVDGNMIIIGLG